MKNRNAIILLCLVLVLPLFHGCILVGPDFTPPQVDRPDNFKFAPPGARSDQDIKWWELFDDPVLYELVTICLDNNRDLKIAASRIREARAALGIARADQYPGIDIQAGGSIGNYGGSRSRTTNSNIYISPMLNWELDFWGKFKRATAAAQARILASEFGSRTVRIRLVADVASAYYQLLDYRHRLEISQVTLESRQDSLGIIQQRFDKGIIPEIDLNQAQIQKEIAAGAIPQYQRMIAKTEQTLNLLLGRLPQSVEIVISLEKQALPPYIPTVLPAELIERRPDIRQSLSLLHARNEEVGVAVAQRFPAFSLTAGIGLASSELSNITNQGGIWTGSAGLLGPLFDYQKSKRRVEAEEEQTLQALFEYENLVLVAFGEVEDALVEVDTYRREMEVARRKVAAADNAAHLSFERYDKGVSSYLEVLDSQRTLFSVNLELSDIQRLYFSAYVKLYKALGGGWATKAEFASKATPVESSGQSPGVE